MKNIERLTDSSKIRAVVYAWAVEIKFRDIPFHKLNMYETLFSMWVKSGCIIPGTRCIILEKTKSNYMITQNEY